MTEFKKVDALQPTGTKIELLNDMILALYGLNLQGKFDVNEILEIQSIEGMDRKFIREQSLGHTTADYTDWTHLKTETGYSIWKITPPNYEYNTVNNLYFDDKLLENRGLALSELSSAFDAVYRIGEEENDYTSEAAVEGDQEFITLEDSEDYLYIGLDEKFNGVKLEFHTPGLDYSLKVEYYNASSGDGFVELTTQDDNLEDETSNFASDGRITFDAPTDWQITDAFSGDVDKYYIRISTTQDPAVIAQAYYIVPADSVVGLLALSSSQIENEEWAWCTYGDDVYVTIRNTGNAVYEGSFFIKSSSSETNKKNYFIYNHEFKGDYEDSTYLPSTGVSPFFQDPVADKDLTAPPSGPSTGDRYLLISVDSGTDWSGHAGEIAEWTGSAWDFTTPQDGVLVAVNDEDTLYLYDGSAWITPYATTASLQAVADDLTDHENDVANPHSVNKADVNLPNVTDDAQLKRSDADWDGFSEKTTPHDDDIILIEDSEASGAKKRVKKVNIAGAGGGGAIGAKARAWRSGNQSITAFSNVKVNLNAETYDPDSAFDHTVNYRYDVQETGYAQVNLHVLMSGFSSGELGYAYIYKNGSSIAASSEFADSNGLITHDISDFIEVTAGDYIEMYVRQHGSAARNVSGAEPNTFMSIVEFPS